MGDKEKIVIGTRASPLALAQSSWFGKELQKVNPGLIVEFKKITTSGDRIQDRFLAEVGGKGLFVKEIEEALLSRNIDLAVHSLKDVPAQLPDPLEIGCLPQREDYQDVLISNFKGPLTNLPKKFIIGTTSLRRRVQIKQLHESVQFEMLRGNIDSRLKRLQAKEFDGIILAKAGMKRLGFDISQTVDLPIVPAPGQGTLGIEIRKEDSKVKKLIQPLHHLPTEIVSKAEREVMRLLGGGCNLPLGVLAKLRDKQMELSIFISDLEGKTIIHETMSGFASDPILLAQKMVTILKDNGANSLMS